MIIKGYKAFNGDRTNQKGKLFEEQKIYTVEGPLVFGTKGNGIHFCERLEDTLMFFDAMNKEVAFAEVTSLEDVRESWDDYNEYYDMYAARSLRIDHFLTREEILEMYYNMPGYRIIRFLQGFRLTPEEIELFKYLYSNERKVIATIAYYQEGDKEAFQDKKNKVYTKDIKGLIK